MHCTLVLQCLLAMVTSSLREIMGSVRWNIYLVPLIELYILSRGVERAITYRKRFHHWKGPFFRRDLPFTRFVAHMAANTFILCVACVCVCCTVLLRLFPTAPEGFFIKNTFPAKPSHCDCNRGTLQGTFRMRHVR